MPSPLPPPGNTRRVWVVTISIVVGLLLLVICAWPTVRKQLLSAYHVEALHEAKGFEFAERHRKALIDLGCFEHREFELKQRHFTTNNAKELSGLIGRARLQNADYSLFISNNAQRLHLTFYKGDLKAWQRIVQAFDSGKDE